MYLLTCLLLLPGQIEIIDSKDFAKEVQTAATTGTVEVINDAQGMVGSGVIIRQSGPFVYVLTAWHIVDKSDRVEIVTFSAKSYPKTDQTFRSAQVLARAKDADLALVRLTTRAAIPTPLRLCAPQQVPKDKSFPVLTVGCSGGQAPTCLINMVKDRKTIRKPGDETAFVWEIDSAPVKGRSGGPLLDKQGRVLGIGSGTSDGKGYYSHIDEIQRFLRQNGFKWLYEEDKEK